jgi:hypothetical protein
VQARRGANGNDVRDGTPGDDGRAAVDHQLLSTKQQWRGKARKAWIETGLHGLRRIILARRVESPVRL